MTKFAPAALAALAALAVIAVAGSAPAQAPAPAAPPPAAVMSVAAGAAGAPAKLADFKGMLGDWAGPLGVAGFSMTPDGQIVGHLEVSNGTTPRIMELWIFRPDGDSVTLHQKHFGPDLAAREDKEVWGTRKLAAIDKGHVYLDGVTWITQGDTLTLLVRLGGGANGAPPNITTNVMKRVK